MPFVSLVNHFTTKEKQAILWAINYCMPNGEPQVFSNITGEEICKKYLGIRSADERIAASMDNGFNIISNFSHEQQKYFTVFIFCSVKLNLEFINKFLISCGFTQAIPQEETDSVAQEIFSFYKHFSWTEKEYCSQFEFDYAHSQNKEEFWKSIYVEGEQDVLGALSFWKSKIPNLSNNESKLANQIIEKFLMYGESISDSEALIKSLDEYQCILAKNKELILEEEREKQRRIEEKIRKKEETIAQQKAAELDRINQKWNKLAGFLPFLIKLRPHIEKIQQFLDKN